MNRDFQKLQEQSELLRSELISSADFKKISAPLGIYEQRNGRFMIRLRIPGGDIDVDRLSRLAEVCRENRIESLHLTTRQDIQLHDVELDRVHPAVIQAVENGFVFRGGGGDT